MSFKKGRRMLSLVKALNDAEATEVLLGVEGVDDALAQCTCRC